NVLHQNAAMELSVFLDHEAQFNRRYGLYSTAPRYESVSEVSEQEWLSSEEPDRFYQFGDYGGAALEYEHSVNFLRFQKFFYFLRSPEFKAMMEAMSGLELGPPLINAYRYEAGDFLKVHDDDARDKHLSFIFYLSPDWQPGLGGILHMTQSEGEALRIAPDFNSLVVFDVTNNAEHYISAVESNAGNRARLSISGWFRKFGAPQRSLPSSSPSLA
ncbi:MAG: 2OG-Fe(II) oxygenase family protein, partial [Blastocatellia bacterium]